jgi:hypothetical protein
MEMYPSQTYPNNPTNIGEPLDAQGASTTPTWIIPTVIVVGVLLVIFVLYIIFKGGSAEEAAPVHLSNGQDYNPGVTTDNLFASLLEANGTAACADIAMLDEVTALDDEHLYAVANDYKTRAAVKGAALPKTLIGALRALEGGLSDGFVANKYCGRTSADVKNLSKKSKALMQRLAAMNLQ